MIHINWRLIIVIILLIGTIVIIVSINNLSKKNNLTDTTPVAVNPVNNPFAKDCANTRVTCNPKDPQSCAISCIGPEEYKCVDLDSITPTATGKAINGGGYVCLPDYPTIDCKTDHGGVYVWTGYGFTDNQTWDCYCMYPEYFGGPGCDKINPDICSGGTLDLSSLKNHEPTSAICTCPQDKKLLLRAGVNTPYCESTTPMKDGPMFGLAGSLYSGPDWRNILFRRVGKGGNETLDQWATEIVTELAISSDPKNPATQGLISAVSSVLNKVNTTDCVTCAWGSPCSDHCGNNTLSRINQDTADMICSAICPNSCNTICDCKSHKALWSDEISAAGTKAWYTYDPTDIPPDGKCTS